MLQVFRGMMRNVPFLSSNASKKLSRLTTVECRGPLANAYGPPPYTSEALSKRLLRAKGPFHPTNHSFCSASHRSSTPPELPLVDILLGPTVMFLTEAPKTTPNPLSTKSYASLPNSAIAFSPVSSLHPKIWRVGTPI